ncbi:carbohydrate ABC transporter permease [Falsiroseomonas selenitidurans]|uniref:Sugar ABC transporter permease n=1 Tax=Falsiroseomonas selenitidurans TaxID=2716335 RepID=A0ABX1E6Q4_9PROT|nr:sugar ABC transporter permease [Falsiroseomonas selenitidurans]NKC32869.1 sugar ABC transporter permease [Falsiroseomonas selenitidurans]
MQGGLARQRRRSAWLFLAPVLAVLLAVAGWPLARTLWFSFTDARLDAMAGAGFIGLENYAWLADDPDWWRAVRNTLVFAGISVMLETLLGLVIALVLNARMPGRGALRAAMLIPWAIPTVVSAQMWGWMLHDQYGVVNALLLGAGLITEPWAWTANPNLALGAVIAVDVWKSTPFMALLLLAALQMLPGELHEAAEIDGLGPVGRFFRITLPLIWPALMVAVIFRSLDALRVFDLMYVLTGNSSATASVSVYARQQLVDFQDVGFGSAAATGVVLLVAAVTALLLVFGRVRLGEAAGR